MILKCQVLYLELSTIKKISYLVSCTRLKKISLGKHVETYDNSGKYAIIISMVMEKQFQDNNQTNIKTCHAYFNVTSSEQFDWCNPIFSATNIF